MFKQKHFLDLAFCLFILFIPATASGEGGKYYFKNIGAEQGLSHNTVYAILQDSRGFMWFGTKDGLNRYDGHHFKVFRYDPKKPYSLGNHSVLSLHEDRNGKLWIGTLEGVYLYDPRQERFTAFELQSEDKEMVTGAVLEIRQDQDGYIWMASSTKGLFRYSPAQNSMKYFRHEPGKPGSLAYGSLSSLAIDNEGTVWVGILGGGVQKYLPATGTFEEYFDKSRVLKNDLILDLFSFGNTLFIGTKNGGLKKLDKDSGLIEDVFTHDKENNPLFVRHIEKFNNNKIWIGTELGLYLYDVTNGSYERIFENANDPYSLSDNAIYVIYKDKEGGWWTGTYFGGLSYLPNQPAYFEKYYPISNFNSVSGKRVREFAEGPDNKIWIGTEDAGLNCFDPVTKKFTHFKPRKSLNSISYHNVHGLLWDDSELWISSHSQGLKMDILDLETGTIRKFNKSEAQNPLFDSDVFALYKDSRGTIWIGTISGVYKYRKGSDEISLVQTAGINFTYDIAEDPKGNMWFATYNNGLVRYDPHQNTSRFYRPDGDPASLPHTVVTTLFFDSQQRLWLGTEGGGFALYNEITDDFSTFTTENGLPSNVVYKILEDDQQNLWISTSRGLVEFNPATQAMRVFNKSNGLLANQFNYKSGIKTSDGTIYFGCLNGFIAFNPASFSQATYDPPVVFTDIKLFNKEVPIGGEETPLQKSIIYTDALKLRHYQSSLSFSFAALSFTAPESRKYAYVMEGIDKTWNYLSQNKEVTYSNLPPGRYLLKVKTAGQDGHWSNREAQMVVNILPPFWKTNWAYFIYSVSAIGLLYFLISSYKTRVARKHEEKLKILEDEKEKEIYHAKIDFFTSITHEIRTPLTLIKGPLEEILKKEGSVDEQTRENLRIMERNSNRLINLSNQLLDFRKTEKQGFSLNFVVTDISEVLVETHYRFKMTAHQQNLDFELYLPSDHFFAAVDPEALTKILSNLVSNAIKFAEKKVYIHLSSGPKSANIFEVAVSNDGRLVAENLREKIFEPFFQIKDSENKTIQSGTGLGLPLARSLAELHEGKLFLDRTPAKDMNRFVLQLPVKQKNTLDLDPGFDDLEEQVQDDKELLADMQDHAHKPTVLVVEDSRDLTKFIYDHLKNDYLVYRAANGEQAVKVLDEKPVDLVISDIMMPVMNGFELCKTVKSELNYSHIPVILLTAKSNIQSKIEGMEMGADVYIEKPFSMEYLQLQVKNLLHYRDQIRQSFVNSPVVHAHTIAHTRADELFLTRVNQAIYDNISNELFGVNELAGALNMSQSSLLRKTKGISNLTPNGYIRLVRLKKAAELLNQGEYSISGVCTMVGFNSPSYFSKCFQKQFGELPKDYIKVEQ